MTNEYRNHVGTLHCAARLYILVVVWVINEFLGVLLVVLLVIEKVLVVLVVCSEV